MKVTFQFNPKSSGQNVSIAISLVKECGGIIENDLCQIDFDSLDDNNFRRLCFLVGNLKESSVSINDEEPINARIIRHIATCAYKYQCKEIFECLTSESQVSDENNLKYEDSQEDYSDDILESDLPSGYICKTIRLEDGVVVDISYKTFEEMLKIWEEANYLSDEYVFNVIKSVYEKNEDLIQKSLKNFQRKYGIEK